MFPEDGPTGAAVRVAVIDTGVDLDHPDFQGAVDEASQSLLSTDDLLLEGQCGMRPLLRRDARSS